MNGSAPGAQYEIGYIRLPTQFLPGMVAELRLAPGGWPTSRWSWPTFWAFSGVQIPDKPGNITRWYATYPPALENDFFDGYPDDNSTQGLRIPNGTPFSGDQCLYHYPDDVYMQGAGDFSYVSQGGGGAGVNQLNIPPKFTPTNSSNPGLTVVMDWSDQNTIKYIYNGELVRIRHIYNPPKIAGGLYVGYDGTAPPADVLGQPLPQFIMISHQFAPKFNYKDIAALNATTGPIVANYDIMSIRIWNKPTTMTPTSSTPSVALPPPITSPKLGDLPQIATGTYVMNIEVSGGVVMDHFGSNVSLAGTASVVASGINSKPCVQAGGSGGISVQGPAISHAQNGGNFMMFQVVTNVNPYTGTAVYMQFSRQFPSTDTIYEKPMVYMNPNRVLVAQLESSRTGDLAQSNSTYVVNPNVVHLVTMNHSLAIDNTVTIGLGYGSTYWTPAEGKGVPASQLDGYTELLIGAGRNRYNHITSGANIVIGQTIMVAFEPGHSLADDDLLKIRQYLTAKWNIPNLSNTTVKNVTQMQPQPGTYTPPAKTSFASVNAGPLGVSGGSTTPLVLTLAPQTSNDTAMQLISLSASTHTFTALINFSIPWSLNILGTYPNVAFTSMNGGISLRNSNTNNVTTFGLFFQDNVSGGFRSYWYAPSANGSLAAEVRRWYAIAGRPLWMRVVVDATTGFTTLLASVTGRVNEWEVIFRIPTAWTSADQIGFYLNSVAPSGFTSILHMDALSNTADYQVQSALFTSSFPPPTAPPTSPPASTTSHATSSTPTSSSTSTHPTTTSTTSTSLSSTTTTSISSASSSHGSTSLTTSSSSFATSLSSTTHAPSSSSSSTQGTTSTSSASTLKTTSTSSNSTTPTHAASDSPGNIVNSSSKEHSQPFFYSYLLLIIYAVILCNVT